MLPPAGPTSVSRSQTSPVTANPVADELPQRLSWRPGEHYRNRDTPNTTNAGPEAAEGPPQPQPNAPQLPNLSPLLHGLPPAIVQTMRSHVELMNQLGAQTAANGITGQSARPPPFTSANLHPTIALEQQARGAAGLHGLSNDDPHSTGEAAADTPMPSQEGPTPPDNPTIARLSGDGRTVRENHGTNAQLWRVTVTGPAHHYQGQHSHPVQHSRPLSVARNHQDQHQAPALTAGPLTPPAFEAQPAGETNSGPMNGRSAEPTTRVEDPDHFIVLEECISALEADLAEGTAPAEPIFAAARTVLRRISSQNGVSSMTRNRLHAHLDNLSTRADQIRAGYFMRGITDAPAAQRPRPPGSFSPIYLLSSPSGPHALLVSPYGMYAAPWPLPGQNGTAAYSILRERLRPTQSINPSHEPNAPPQNSPANVPQEVQEPQQRRQEQPANQARDLVRILLPLGGHIWLLVRLFGFVYFFTSGGGYRRALLLGLCAFLVFIIQTGIFRPFLQSAWDPIRRHMENLLPLANNDRRLLPEAAAGGNNANQPLGQHGWHPNMVPTPYQAAERLLREREHRGEGWTRQYLRRAERAVALFVASLVPGVGERHIAARDAAESARIREERERDMEREERNRQEERERNEAEREEDRRSNDRQRDGA